ncbi:NADH-quinone oxidoreductase subunit C [Dactylosporangium sp. CA-139066]|uniref:NADH-quinone oxidoreductase subunit C n=1 Tax=Dactylosporangium sp. CA-139066 TaxID=3239930 RepID=UPI003D8AB723
MTPAEVGARLVEALQQGEASESGGGKFARATVDVPVEAWVEAVEKAKTVLGCDFFDWLSAVDELPGGFSIVAHLWSSEQKHGVLLRTQLPRETPEIATIIRIFPGAKWHERETHEMFGIAFIDHEDMRPLLLPEQFEGHPLRKEFVLASRVAKPWPGAKEPGESEHTVSKRGPMRPPGVPSPDEWPGGRG